MKDIYKMRCIPIILILLPHIFASDHASNHRINLDDIERDNVRSEKLAKNANHKDIFELQQTQNYNSKTLEFYRQQLKELKEMQDEQNTFETTSTPEPPINESPSAKGSVIYATTPTPAQLSYKIESSTPSPSAQSALLNYPFSYNIINYHPTPSYQHDPVQYVTIAPKPKYLYETEDESEKASPVESSHTYSSSAREPQSNARPISATIASYLNQHHRQPHYLYIQPDGVQSKSIQSSSQHVANDILYAATAPGSSHAPQRGTPAPIIYSHDEDVPSTQHQQYETAVQDGPTNVNNQQEDEPIQQDYQSGYRGDANQQHEQVQYVPYIGQGPSQHQSYVTMVAIPTTQGQSIQPIRFTPSVITYSHSGPASITPVVGGLHPNIQYLPSTLPNQPTGPLQYVNTNDLDEVPPAAQYSSQQQDVQYVDPEQISARPSMPNGSKQFKYAPKHPEGSLVNDERQNIEQQHQQQLQPQTISYLIPQRVVPLNQPYQYTSISQPQISVQPLNQFQPYREPKSLLDSYVPSWVILQRQQEQQQRLIFQQQQQQRSLSSQQATAAPYPYHYDTIAYSTHQQPLSFESTNHLKRSTTTLTKVDGETRKTK